MALVFIFQACPWESLCKCRFSLQIHTGILLKDFTKARRVWGTETPDTQVHQAGLQLWARGAESGGWRQVLQRWLCGKFCYFCFNQLWSALFLNCPTLSFTGYSPLTTVEQESKRSGKCFYGVIHPKATKYLSYSKLVSLTLKLRGIWGKSPEI